jgi:hypothetical protein
MAFYPDFINFSLVLNKGNFYIIDVLSGNSSVVERHLAKVDVASSSLVSRSRKIKR